MVIPESVLRRPGLCEGGVGEWGVRQGVTSLVLVFYDSVLGKEGDSPRRSVRFDR